MRYIKRVSDGGVYYSTTGIAVSYNSSADVTIHVGKKSHTIGTGMVAFLHVLRILRKYEELGWEGVPPPIRRLIEEYSSYSY